MRDTQKVTQAPLLGNPTGPVEGTGRAGGTASPGQAPGPDVDPPGQAAPLATVADDASLFERWARDPAIDVGKFERFMVMWERERARRQEQAFDAAMSAAQNEMEPVRKDSYNEQTKSRFASSEALDAEVRPIYTAHGFGLSFDTGDDPAPEMVRMLCYVSHTAGHRRTYKLDLPADGKGAKGGDVMTRTHATVSATSYGQRVLLRMIFNIAIGGDDDGNRAGGGQPVGPPAPPKYAAWVASLQTAAEKGLEGLEAAWACSDAPLKNHMVNHDKTTQQALKKTAAQASQQAAKPPAGKGAR